MALNVTIIVLSMLFLSIASLGICSARRILANRKQH